MVSSSSPEFSLSSSVDGVPAILTSRAPSRSSSSSGTPKKGKVRKPSPYPSTKGAPAQSAGVPSGRIGSVVEGRLSWKEMMERKVLKRSLKWEMGTHQQGWKFVSVLKAWSPVQCHLVRGLVRVLGKELRIAGKFIITKPFRVFRMIDRSTKL